MSVWTDRFVAMMAAEVAFDAYRLANPGQDPTHPRFLAKMTAAEDANRRLGEVERAIDFDALDPEDARAVQSVRAGFVLMALPTRSLTSASPAAAPEPR